MEQRHRKAIKKNLVSLSKDLDFEVLEPHLLAGDIFPDGRLDAFKVGIYCLVVLKFNLVARRQRGVWMKTSFYQRYNEIGPT